MSLTVELVGGPKEWPSIWCNGCGCVAPLLADFLPAGELYPGSVPNPHDAMDLVCGECKLIIATLHDQHRVHQRSTYVPNTRRACE